MPTLAPTLEVDVRRCSAQDLLLKLEKTMGVRLNVRRARVTLRRSRLSCEVLEPTDLIPSRPPAGS